MGVHQYVVCAGGRNQSLLQALESRSADPHQDFSLVPAFDERAAAFFAMGRMRSSGQSVAVVTTSGTAVAELLPATVEAYHQQLPLILITADRPKRDRGRGTPQGIEQAHLLATHAKILDLEVSEERSNSLSLLDEFLTNWDHKTPLHLNLCFEEYPGNLNLIKSLDAGSLSFLQENSKPTRRPLILVGPVCGSSEVEKIEEILFQLGIPFFAENLSQLRGRKKLQGLLVTSSMDGAKSWLSQVSEVWRLGGVPTARLWRDLESTSEENLPVYTVQGLETDYPPGLARKTQSVEFSEILKQISSVSDEWKKFLLQSNDLTLKSSEITRLLFQVQSHWERVLKNSVLQGSCDAILQVYLGNSLTIRHFEREQFFSSDFSHGNLISWWGHRGANGIDGQISGFLGWCSGERKAAVLESWAIVGDLTTLYDLNSLWFATKANPHGPEISQPLRILIVNNGGGQIFRKWNSQLALNSHELNFQNWAQQFGWSYLNLDSSSFLSEDLPSRVIIEANCKDYGS